MNELANAIKATPEATEEALLRLTYRQREILRARYGIGRPRATLDETAEEFATSRLDVRMAEARALAALRRACA